MFRMDFDSVSMHHAAMLTGGWALIAAGLLTLPLPGPFSTPAFALGGLMLTRRSRSFRRVVAGVRSIFPSRSVALTECSRHWPRPIRYIVLRTDPRRMG